MAAHIAIGLGSSAHGGEQRPKHPTSARLGVHIDTLDPPQIAIAPVAPLVGDHETADDTCIDLGNEVEAGAGALQKTPHATRHRRQI